MHRFMLILRQREDLVVSRLEWGILSCVCYIHAFRNSWKVYFLKKVTNESQFGWFYILSLVCWFECYKFGSSFADFVTFLGQFKYEYKVTQIVLKSQSSHHYTFIKNGNYIQRNNIG
jgi:hypothetical protein